MRRLVLLVVVLAIALQGGVAQATPFPVTTTADSGPGSLRAAIDGANEGSGTDTIPIEVSGTIELDTALPQIFNGGVSITGPGSPSLTITRAASAPKFRIFEIGPFIAASLEGMTISNGVAEVGAGIYSGSALTLSDVVLTGNKAVAVGGPEPVAIGGAIASGSEPLIIRRSVIRGNRAVAKEGSSKAEAGGGGIVAAGPLTLEDSTIAGNSVEAVAEGGQESIAVGGGLLANGPSATTRAIDRSTISGNSVLAAEGSVLDLSGGGGVSGSKVELTSSTVSGNSATALGNGQGSNLDVALTSVVRDTIVAEPLGDGEDCSGEPESGGFNIDEDGSCGFDQGSDLAKVDPGLDPVLKDNGGPTPTHALLAGSVAIDRGNAFGAITDQRGLPRPSDFAAISNLEGGDGSDVGAFELQAPPVPQSPPGVAVVSLIAGDKAPPNTRILRGPSRVTFKRLAKFLFNSTEAQSSFQCKVDKRPWRGCRSPWKRRVSAGAKHLFKVRAIDRFGNVDPTPARFGWRVKALGG